MTRVFKAVIFDMYETLISAGTLTISGEGEMKNYYSSINAPWYEVLDTSELDRVATRLQDQALGMAERIRKLVEENARVRMDQEE